MNRPHARTVALCCAVACGPLAILDCSLISLSAFDSAGHPGGDESAADSSTETGGREPDDALGPVGSSGDADTESDSFATEMDDGGATARDATTDAGDASDAAMPRDATNAVTDAANHAGQDAPADVTKASADGSTGSDGAGTTDAAPVALPETLWGASAFDPPDSSAWPAGDAPANALDGSLTTRWSTNEPQVAGQWFEVDMVTPQTFSQVSLDSGPTSAQDYPRSFELEMSNDGTTWTNIVAGTGSTELVTVSFPQKTARFIRVVVTGSAGVFWWSIAEFDVYD